MTPRYIFNYLKRNSDIFCLETVVDGLVMVMCFAVVVLIVVIAGGGK